MADILLIIMIKSDKEKPEREVEDFLQPKDGYRFSEDSISLAEYIQESISKDNPVLSPGHRLNALEIGTGCGLISIMLARTDPAILIDAYEIQSSLAGFAVANTVLHGVESTVTIHNEDIFSNPKADYYDMVFCNPPYQPISSGRISPHPSKALAKHELTLDMPTLLEKTSFLLKKHGLFFCIYPLIRKDELMALSLRHALYPLVLKVVRKERILAMMRSQN